MTDPEKQLRKLFPHLLGRHPAGCLSLYLAAGPGYDPSYYAGLIKDVRRELEQGLDEERRPRFEAEVLHVERFLGEVRPPGLPLAIFSCSQDGLFDARRLPEDVETRGRFEETFDLRPLEEQLRRHPAGLVAVVEKDKAMVFAVVLEDVHELAEIVGRHVSDTRKSPPNSSRHHDKDHERLNVKDAAELLVKSGVQNLGLDAIYLAGPVRERAAFKKMLPEHVRRQVRGELDLTVKLPPGELADRIRQLT